MSGPTKFVDKVEHEISIECSSDTKAGAINVSPDGSSFEIKLHKPIEVPKNAYGCKVSVESAQVWWTIINVIDGKNVFHIKLNDDEYETYEIDPGLYDAHSLQTALRHEWSNAHSNLLPFSIQQNQSTQKIVFVYASEEADDVILIDFSEDDTPRELLGFDSAVVTVDNDTNKVVTADNVVRFNTVNSFHICSDLVEGMRINNKYRNLLLDVPILARPGSLVVYEPFRPPN